MATMMKSVIINQSLNLLKRLVQSILRNGIHRWLEMNTKKNPVLLCSLFNPRLFFVHLQAVFFVLVIAKFTLVFYPETFMSLNQEKLGRRATMACIGMALSDVCLSLVVSGNYCGKFIFNVVIKEYFSLDLDPIIPSLPWIRKLFVIYSLMGVSIEIILQFYAFSEKIITYWRKFWMSTRIHPMTSRQIDDPQELATQANVSNQTNVQVKIPVNLAYCLTAGQLGIGMMYTYLSKSNANSEQMMYLRRVLFYFERVIQFVLPLYSMKNDQVWDFFIENYYQPDCVNCELT